MNVHHTNVLQYCQLRQNLFHRIFFFFQQKIRQFIQLGIYGGVGFSIIAFLKGEPKFYRNVRTYYILYNMYILFKTFYFDVSFYL